MTTPVRYIRVQAKTNFFSPATRPTGNIAIIGAVTPPAGATDLIDANKPTVFVDPDDAIARAPGALGTAVALALRQEPGPGTIYGVRLASTPNYTESLATIATLPVQLVVIAGARLSSGTPAESIVKLADHVKGPFADGLERMGVAMLAKGDTDPAVITGTLSTDRMVYVAHKSDEDVAAAVAGTIGGYEPHVSLLLKKVNGVDSEPFTAGELVKLNGSENNDAGPAGHNVNWLVNPALIPGEGIYLGEGYTGASGLTDKKYIDIVRTLDDITYRLKASLIATIGDLRMTRTGLRALTGEMEAVLEPLRRTEVIDDYEVVVPILALLDKPQPTQVDKDLIKAARDARLAESLVRITYAGAIHRLTIKLTFE
ncbi:MULTISPECIES: hypothetical protein [unclassified Streptomyces]|uniref:hypothetical protein n=1 Tax=unclassified Streptomyces TaxID=2593676 RepID=UPI00341DC1A6